MPASGTSVSDGVVSMMTALPTVGSAAVTRSATAYTLTVTLATNLGGSTNNAATDNIAFVYTGSATGLTLSCSGSGTNVEDKYLPSECRS